MPATPTENVLAEASADDLLAAADRLTRAQSEELAAEGEALLDAVRPFQLQPELQAAILLYPAFREERLTWGSLEGGPLEACVQAVDGLVQLGRFSLPDDWKPGEALATQQSDALRRMLLAVVSDPRLVLIRVAEQLLRLRAAKNQPEEQHRLALETREVYAPVASRLGAWQFKWELEDLAFRFLEPDTYKRIARMLKEKRAEREEFIESVRQTLETELTNAGIEAEVSGRPKHIYSIWRKMQKKSRGLEQIFDVRAVRVFVHDVAKCYAALGVVHHRWQYLPGEFDDYIANPKENNYQSLHTAVV